jgi:hypothetical protein
MYSWNLIPFNFSNSLLKYSCQRFSKESSSLLVQIDKFFEHYSFSFKQKVLSFERSSVRELNAHHLCVASHLTRTLLNLWRCHFRSNNILLPPSNEIIVNWSWLFVFLHVFPHCSLILVVRFPAHISNWPMKYVEFFRTRLILIRKKILLATKFSKF